MSITGLRSQLLLEKLSVRSKYLIFKVFFFSVIDIIELMRCFNFYKHYIFALICCLFTSVSYGAQWATVSSKKAVIYSDVEMTSVIGYVKRGKKIRVGNKAKNKGRLLPLIVNKKVLYIEIKDIQTNEKLAQLNNAIERVKKKSEVIESESRISVTGGALFSNTSSPDFDGESDDVFTGGGAFGYFGNLRKKTLYRSGLSYYTLQESRDDKQFSFSLMSIPIDYYIPLIKTSHYDFHIYLGGIIVPFAEYRVANDFTLNGYGLGASLGSEMIFKVTKRWAFHAEGSYRYIYTTGFKFPQIDNYPTNASFILSGVNIVGAISYKY
jgi:hypothetical protein